MKLPFNIGLPGSVFPLALPAQRRYHTQVHCWNIIIESLLISQHKIMNLPTALPLGDCTHGKRHTSEPQPLGQPEEVLPGPLVDTTVAHELHLHSLRHVTPPGTTAALRYPCPHLPPPALRRRWAPHIPDTPETLSSLGGSQWCMKETLTTRSPHSNLALHVSPVLFSKKLVPFLTFYGGTIDVVYKPCH